MKIGARNILKGEIVDIAKGGTTSLVKIDIGGGTIITASLTNASAEELGLAPGRKAYAVFKATDVLVGVD